MRTLKKFSGVALFSVIMLATVLQAQIATEITWYTFPVSLPDVMVPEFGTARDNLLTRLKMGGALATGSRVNNPLGLEIRTTAEAGDFSVSGVSNIWRGIFNPGGKYATQHGQRWYVVMLAVGVNGKVSLDRFSYQVLCGVGLLSNQASLAGLTYSVSRIGILVGADGKLFTPDDIYLQAGEAGITMVDAVLFIGGRIGANVSNAQDLASLDAAIGPNGTYATYRYMFQSSSKIITHDCTTWIYPQGMIPAWRNTVEVFRGPKGLVFSLVGPADSKPITLHSARSILGPWTLETDSAVEGTSGYLAFTGDPVNDQGYFRLGTPIGGGGGPEFNGRLRSRTVIGSDLRIMAISTPGSDVDQDR